MSRGWKYSPLSAKNIVMSKNCLRTIANGYIQQHRHSLHFSPDFKPDIDCQAQAVFYLIFIKPLALQEVILLYIRSYANEQAQYNDLYNKGHLSETALRSLLSVLPSQIDSLRYFGEYRSIYHNSLPI
jgi:hypothetical protein